MPLAVFAIHSFLRFSFQVVTVIVPPSRTISVLPSYSYAGSTTCFNSSSPGGGSIDRTSEGGMCLPLKNGFTSEQTPSPENLSSSRFPPACPNSVLSFCVRPNAGEPQTPAWSSVCIGPLTDSPLMKKLLIQRRGLPPSAGRSP